MPRLHAVWNRDEATQALTKLTVFETQGAARELVFERSGNLMNVTIRGASINPSIIVLDRAGFESLCERTEEFRRQWPLEDQGVPT